MKNRVELGNYTWPLAVARIQSARIVATRVASEGSKSDQKNKLKHIPPSDDASK